MAEPLAGDPTTREWQGRMMQSAGPASTSDRWHFFDLQAMEETPVITADQPDPAEAKVFLKALVNHTDPEGFSLQAVRYAPGAYIPRHHHDVAQVVMILEGEAFLGNRRFGPGQGYYTPAGKGYSVQVGEAGVTLVEFRHSPLTIETVWLDDPKLSASQG